MKMGGLSGAIVGNFKKNEANACNLQKAGIFVCSSINLATPFAIVTWKTESRSHELLH